MTSFEPRAIPLRVAFRWSKSPMRGGGIGRYVEKITGLLSDQQIAFHAIPHSLSPGLGGALRNVFFLLRDLIMPSARINSDTCDIYWGVAHRLPLFRVSGVLYVVTIHDLVWKACPRTMPLRRLLAEMLLFPIALSRADVILAVSESTAKDVGRYFPEHKRKIRVTPLGAGDKSSTELRFSGTKGHYFLFVGTIEPRKNVLRLIDAYALLPEIVKKKRKLLIVGNRGWGKVLVTKRIRKLGLDKFVEYKGYVDDDQLEVLYREAYCLVMPSLYEGFGLPIVEAQKYGVPVITSNISSMPDVAGDGALLVDPHSVESIAAALARLDSSARLHQELSQNAFVNSKRFNWEETAFLTRLALVELVDKARTKI